MRPRSVTWRGAYVAIEGLTSLETTMHIYGRLFEGVQKEAAERYASDARGESIAASAWSLSAPDCISYGIADDLCHLIDAAWSPV